MPSNADLAGRRIALVLHSFDRGGSGRVAAYLARGFSDLGMTVEIICFAQGGEVEGVAEQLAGKAVAIRYLGRLGPARPLDLAGRTPALTRRLRETRPDFVIACANNAALATTIGFRMAGLRASQLYLKTTNPIASSRHKGVVRSLRRLSYRLIFPSATEVWTLSAEESAEMRQVFPAFSALFREVANPYVTPAMLAPPPALAARPPGKTIISVARLNVQKRLERLILAFAHVRAPEARLIILGDGEERAALTRLVAEHGLSDRVSMPGYVNDVAAALHRADLFVLPSDYEGLPAVVLEAMAANCPVLGTDCFPAARALLDGTEGCAIIERTDPGALARLIEAHLGQPRPTALRAIAERYSIPAGVASHAEALRASLRGVESRMPRLEPAARPPEQASEHRRPDDRLEN